jgi:hypothetical protein
MDAVSTLTILSSVLSMCLAVSEILAFSSCKCNSIIEALMAIAQKKIICTDLHPDGLLEIVSDPGSSTITSGIITVVENAKDI